MQEAMHLPDQGCAAAAPVSQLERVSRQGRLKWRPLFAAATRIGEILHPLVQNEAFVPRFS